MSRLEGLDRLNRRLNALNDGRSLLAQVQFATIAEAKRTVPRQTSFLGRSISPGILTASYAVVQASAPYAAHVEFGTRPHTIRPRRKRILAWPATAAGRRLSGRPRTATRTGGFGGMRFARIVHHPGTRAQPYLVPAARMALRAIGVRQIIENWNGAA